MSKYEKTERVEGREPVTSKRRFRKMANVISRFLPSPEIRIFEIGCANGQLLALLRDKGYKNVSGIDPSPISAKTALQNYGVQVTENTLSNVNIENGTVDFLDPVWGYWNMCVNSFQPWMYSRKCLQLMVRIFISVPDASRYFEGKTHLTKNLAWSILTFSVLLRLQIYERTCGFKLIFSHKSYQIQSSELPRRSSMECSKKAGIQPRIYLLSILKTATGLSLLYQPIQTS